MSSFTLPLDTRYMPDTENWMVLRSFRYWIGEVDSGKYVDIPYGYRTDGASVPRPFWNIIPPWGPHGQAAVLHDYLCEFRHVMVDGRRVGITRAECDEIFLEAMGVLNIAPFQKNAMYVAVRAYAIATFKY